MQVQVKTIEPMSDSIDKYKPCATGGSAFDGNVDLKNNLLQKACPETIISILDNGCYDKQASSTWLTIAPRRTENGSLGFYRKYQFEVSENGVDRFSGFVRVLGSKIVESHLQGEAGQNIFHQGKSERQH